MLMVHLLRHAKPSPPAERDADTPLSEQGLADSAALVARLGTLGISRIVSSPYRRALETVRPFASHAGIPIETDPCLCERYMPTADGPEQHIERVRLSFGDAEYAPPGGETFREVAERASACLRQRVAETLTGLLLVRHGQCLTLMLGCVSGAGCRRRPSSS